LNIAPLPASPKERWNSQIQIAAFMPRGFVLCALRSLGRNLYSDKGISGASLGTFSNKKINELNVKPVRQGHPGGPSPPAQCELPLANYGWACFVIYAIGIASEISQLIIYGNFSVMTDLFWGRKMIVKKVVIH
jgi:hypothetical protein